LAVFLIQTLETTVLTACSPSPTATYTSSPSRTADEWLPEFLHRAYEPTSEDFRRLKRYVDTRRRTYVANYRPLRHGVFAHRGVMDRAEVGALFGKTNIRELQQLLVFLARLHEALWQLFYNGYKPTLRPARFSVKEMREQPSPQHEQHELQERLIHETERLLKSLSNCTGGK
jgi:HEPN superfamily AbiU2-like protein